MILVTKKFWGGKSDFRSCIEAVVEVLIWLRRDSVATVC